MQIDGIGFNPDWAKKKSEDDFVAEFTAEHMEHIYPDLPKEEKEQALRKAHQVLTGKVEAPAEEKAAG
jgi:hypothetical protein